MFYKKVIGSVVLLFMIIGISLTGYYFVAAKFINSQNLLELDGIVKNVSSTGPDTFTITLLTSGTEPIPIDTNNSTNFVGSLTISDIDSGDHLRIVADIIGNEAVAKSVKRIDGVVGYGTAGDPVQVTMATVESKTTNSFTVDSGVASITFQVNSSTNFAGTTFATLSIDDVVQVHGTDSGINFLAKTVILKEKKIKTKLQK